MLCKNPMCGVRIGEHYWGDGYCSKHCLERGEEYDPDAHDGMPHPDDVASMERELLKNADLTDALTEAAGIDPRLPKIIYLRRKGKTLRQIGAACGMSEITCRRLLGNVAPNLLRECGLR